MINRKAQKVQQLLIDSGLVLHIRHSQGEKVVGQILSRILNTIQHKLNIKTRYKIYNFIKQHYTTSLTIGPILYQVSPDNSRRLIKCSLLSRLNLLHIHSNTSQYIKYAITYVTKCVSMYKTKRRINKDIINVYIHANKPNKINKKHRENKIYPIMYQV